ncbi:MAG: hypothetical protein ACRD8U_25525, partial [Pyrinomonadaceae bacterium]
MDETKQLETLQSLAEVSKERSPGKRAYLASVRVSPGAYFAVSCVLTFSAALLLRSEKDAWALFVVVIAWGLVPVVALTDRISFDGESLIRRGLVPCVVSLISGRKHKLSVSDFERVDTNA